MSALNLCKLGKAFRTYRSEWQRMSTWFGAKPRPLHEEWVLRDINLQVPSGAAVGIVGRNGAGKSTLLKIITGTLRPTEGHVNVNGKIASILELGMGFNPELSGRQNVAHSLALMGHSATEINEVMPAVEDFAEVGEYFDQPVRVYSSGMQMRVAFAVVTAFRPEILIIDEALAVGDAYFQHKSSGRIREFRERGTTLLIVSHDRSAIMGLCDRAVMLDSGRIVKEGGPQEVMDFYNAMIGQGGRETVTVTKLANGTKQTASGTGEASVELIELRDENGLPIDTINVGQLVCLHVRIAAHADIPRLVLGYMLRDRLGQTIYGTNTKLQERVITDVKKGELLDYRFTFFANMGLGSYSVSTALTSSETHHEHNYEWRDLALVFEVVNFGKPDFAGINWMNPAIEILRF